ncbi:MAG: hypothetical protein LUD17_10965, partial [Bacteroidales bacterium]|nr:hypothetical protein [Bacteroidales bacterium]
MKKIYFKSLRPVAVAAVVAMLGTAAPAAMAQDDSTVETLDTETQEAIQAEYEEMIALWQELQLAYAELQERLDAEADLYSEEKLAYFTEQSGLIATTLQQFYNLIQASYEEAMQTGEFEVEYFRLTYQSLAGMISELQFNMDCAKAYAEYEEMTEQVQELFMAYIELQSLLDEEYAGYYDEAESAAIAQALAALQAEIQEAMELSQQTGEFYVENFRQTYQEIYNAILALQQSAENAKAYAEYEEMIELWNELTVAYAELQDLLETEYAGLYDEAESAAIAQAIYALYNDIQAALEISQQTGVFEVEGFHQQYNDIVAAMQALLQSAENAAAYAEYEEMIELWNELTVA